MKRIKKENIINVIIKKKYKNNKCERWKILNVVKCERYVLDSGEKFLLVMEVPLAER